MNVELIDHMGSDLTVVNAARVSFAKESTWVSEYINLGHGDFIEEQGLSDKDRKLINYLADHNHWSPFSHCTATFRIQAPIFVARQLVKHQVGLAWNEESRRYIDDVPTFYTPEQWRSKPENAKQGSGDEFITELLTANSWGWTNINAIYDQIIEDCREFYEMMIEAGVAPEQARIILPVATNTEWYWTGSLYAFARVCNLRLDSHAQQETREVVQFISKAMEERFPVSWKALVK